MSHYWDISSSSRFSAFISLLM